MRKRAALWTEHALLAAGAVLLAGWAAVMLQARLYGFQQQRRLERMIASASAPASAREASRRDPARPANAERRRAPATLAPEDLVGRMEIPRLRLTAIVAEGVSAHTLRLAVGHLPGTALPGGDGNVVLAGHRDTFFRPLKDVRPGDAIELTTPEGRFQYTVEATQVVDPARTDLLETEGPPRLTLVTCYPFYLVGSAPDRFIVRAVRTR